VSSNQRIAHKTGILVEISLVDGTTLYGKLFVPNQGRLSDLLNDERKFLPVDTMDGGFLALAKSAIKQVLLPAPDTAPYAGNNPHSILGVREGVSLGELKEAYHQLCMVNHPDRIKGFGLGADYQELGTKNTVRINNAYSQILKTIQT